jgi:hypothetical protein
VPKKINDSILENNWPRKDANVEDDPYEAPIFAYSKEMDQLMEVNIINNEVEK